jgi:hypothetical protein
MPTYTVNFNFYLPAQGDGDENSQTWADGVNGNFTAIDALLKTHDDGLAEILASRGAADGIAALDSGTKVPVAQLPVMVGAGESHAAGIVPDPGSTSGTTKFLREDGSWEIPGGVGASGFPPWFLPAAFTPPILTDFAWVNQGSASASQGTACLPLVIPANTGDSNRILVKALPSTPYTITMAFVPGLGATFGAQSLILRDSVSGKLITFDLFQHGGEIPYHRVVTWNSATSAVSQIAFSRRMSNSSIVFVKIADDGTNRTYKFSRDGQNWETLLSHARTTWVVPNQVGFCGTLNDATNNGLMNIVHWAVS